MNNVSYRFYGTRRFFVFITSFLLFFAAGILILFFFFQNHIAREKEKATSLAEIYAANLSHEIDNLLSITQSFKAMLIEGDGTIEKLEEIVSEIVGSSSIRNLTLAPEGVVRYVYPLEGNEAAIGHNLLADPDRILEAAMAKESNQLTLSGPYELRQGGFGIIGRLPVYLKNTADDHSFWGFVCVTIDIPSGLQKAGVQNLEQQGYSYELWRISPDNQKKQIIMASDLPLQYETECETIKLPNSTWTLEIAPVNGWLQKTWIIMGTFLVLLFSLLCALLAHIVKQLAVSKNDLALSLSQQTANYKIMNDLNEDIRAFRHDLNNHMISLSSLLDKEDIPNAKAYVHSISDTIMQTTRIINTENYVFDSLLAQKLHEAIQKGIHVEQDISLNKQLEIENKDWCVLFGNALDNAVEACISSGSDNPKLYITVKYQSNILKTSISNTSAPLDSNNTLSTTKDDTRNHGYGLKQIHSVVKKYHGTMEVSYENGFFTLRFLLFYL